MPANNPDIAGVESYLRALRETNEDLRTVYKDDPLSLAVRLGLKLPTKPAELMKEAGVYDIEKHGVITPGLKDLIHDVCTLGVHSAAVVGPRGGGKALSTATPIPTPEGWILMGELKEGDRVYGRDGKPCTVTKAYPVMVNRPCYEVEFDDGTTIIADEDHLWETETWNERASNTHRRKKLASGWQPVGDWRSEQWKGWRSGVRTTLEILNTLDKNHYITNTGSLDCPEVDLPIDPYVLGYWLGDGTTTTGAISVGGEDRDETLRRLRRKWPGEVYVVPSSDDRDNNGGCVIRLEGLTATLRANGLLGDKHVPDVYKRASEGQRSLLLAGLMDSDGWVRKNSNNCEAGFKVERLARDFYELVVSMGWKARFHKRQASYYGKDCGFGYVTNFRPMKNVCLLKRKKNSFDFSVAQSQRHTSRKITAVRPVPSVPVRCIEVDGPDHLFLAGEQMVPTHNSFGVSFIEFYMVFVKGFDALNLGGSELQADQVYQYILGYIESNEFWMGLVKGETTQSKTTTTLGAWIRVLTASQKSVRSPHAGGIKKDGREAGGILVIDEEAEADADIVSAALPTINTALPSVNVRSSTFHNVEGSFAELIENHEEMGYDLYSWDIFDVSKKCDCPLAGICESPEPCFREDHTELVADPDTGELTERIVHRAYCGGRAYFGSGWIPMDEILKLWKRMKRNHDVWEVEAMGQRPSTKGHVIKDHQKWAKNKTTASGDSLYIPGYPVSICVDWGTANAGVEVWQEQDSDKHVLIWCKQVEGAGQTEIFGVIIELWERFSPDVTEVAADIGGGGNYLNPKLEKEYNIPVRGVNFAEEKEIAAAAMNIYNEGGLITLPTEFDLFHSQAKSWKRKKGRIVKGNDHLMDTALCYFAKFVDRLNIRKVRVAPRSTSTVMHTASSDRAATSSYDTSSDRSSSRSRVAMRAPMARSISGKRRG